MQIEIPILYEDENTLVVHKPSGLLSEASDTAPSVITALLSERDGSFLTPITRLDREVSGVMLLAKNKKSAAFYSAELGNKAVFRKEYLAVIEGRMEQDAGELHDLLFKDSAKNKSYAVKRARRGVKEASLSYTVLAEREVDGRSVSLVGVGLHTGRTHQIRVQFSSRRHPILGDRKYGGAPAFPLSLLSYRLSFRLVNGKAVSFTASVPAAPPFSFFEECLSWIGGGSFYETQNREN